MKYKLNKATHDALSDELKALYKLKGDDYLLSVEGMPEPEDVSGIKSKMQTLLDEKKALELKQAGEVKNAVEAALKTAKETGDTAALEASWQQKYDAKVVEMQTGIDGLNGTVTELTSGAEASRLVGEIGTDGSSEVLMPHLTRRLKTEMVDGKPKVTVLGTDGKPSAMTVAELAEEFKGNAAFAPLIRGSKGSGGGIVKPGTVNPGSVDLSTLSPQAKLQYARENPKQT
jgi:hypothetical protein